MSRPLPLVTSLLVCVALAACGDARHRDGLTRGKPRSTPTTTAATQAVAPAGATCQSVAAPPPRAAPRLKPPSARLRGGRTYRATVDTSCGPFTVTLDVARAPRTAASFVALARRGFYDGLTFHRVIAGFLIQGGDPKGDGSGGPGYTTVEPPPDSLKYKRGVLAMAKEPTDDRGTAGSQFFVVTGQDAQLDPDYALLGRVTSGQDTVDRIGVVRTNPQTDRPVEPVVIRSVRIVETKGG